MRSESRLPAHARWIVRLFTPRSVRDEVEGDLAERYAEVLIESGKGSARRWLRWQLLALAPLRFRRRGSGRVAGRGPVENSLRGGLGMDLRFGLRALRLRAGTSFVVVLTVGLAIGATTSVYTVVDGVLLKPLPYPDSEQLVRVWQTKESWFDSPNSQLRGFANRFPISVPTFYDWEAADMGFSSMGAYSSGSLVRQGANGAEILRADYVTSGVFEALGVAPHLGRTLSPEDDQAGAPAVAVLSDRLWESHFSRDESVLGSSLDLDGVPHTIIGVMPGEFRGPTTRPELWASFTEEQKADERDSQYLTVIARLDDGVTIESAAERLTAMQNGLRELYPDDHADVGSRLESLLDAVVGNVRTTLWFLLGAVALVLIVATLNIANVLAVLGLTRRREMAVKAALGAGSARLVRGLFVENSVLAGLGGLLGIVTAWAVLPTLTRLVPPGVPRTESIGMSLEVLAFGILLTFLTTLAVGIAPAVYAASTQPQEMLRGSSRGATGGRTGRRVRAGMVSLEVALAFVLLVAAGLLTSSYARLWSVDRGFATEGLVTMRMVPDPLRYPEQADRERFRDELRERLSAIPGVEVSATNQVPLSGSMSTTTYRIERDDGEDEETNVVINVGMENYLNVMRIPLVAGRHFAESDGPDAPEVAIVNQTMADALWPGEPPLGKRLRSRQDLPWVEVVGVAADVQHQGLGAVVEPKLYVPAAQNRRWTDEWLLRVEGDLTATIELARAAVTAQSPTTPVRSVNVVEESISESVAVPRFRTFFVISLSALAGLLALLGVYGVVTFAVNQRTREIGVRMALGARSDSVVREVVKSGVTLAGIGVAVGALLAWQGTRLLAEFLFGVEPTDLLTFTSIALVVTLVSGAASYLPARRAAAVDPVTVLNSE